jgi:hypothetical protein
MTFREVQTALRCIAARRNERNRFEALLHGMQLKAEPKSMETTTKMDPAKSAFMDEQMKRIVAARSKGARRGK